MATTIEAIAGMLAAEGLNFQLNDDETISLGFQTETYRNILGDPGVMVLIQVLENGEYLKVFAPNAFDARGEFADVLLRACVMVQWKTKLIQFEYDVSDGELRVIVEFPLEDAVLTHRQLIRCVHGLVGILDEFYPVLYRALHEGVIHFQDADERQVEVLSELLSSVPPDILAEALRKADERRRAY